MEGSKHKKPSFLDLITGGGQKLPGHSDFYGGDRFNYTLEDHGSTNPFLKPWRHFRPLDETEDDLAVAVSQCNEKFFQRLMHQGQDYFSHYNKGYRWLRTAGHMFDGTTPDRDMRAWHSANEWTKRWVNKWNLMCECKK